MSALDRKLLFFILLATFTLNSVMSSDKHLNKARYDNYRLVRIHLKTQEHVDIFQELEEESDSIVFYGHALNPDQNVTILVSAHKIFEIYDIVQRYQLVYTVLVSLISKILISKQYDVYS
jgi:hypothetical protein